MQQTTLVAGDSLNYAVTVPEYLPADGWSLKYRLVPRAANASEFTITATASGGEYLVQVGPSQTANWTPGLYAWASWVERTGERYSIAQGQLTIKPDPAQIAAGTDTRSAAEIALEMVQIKLRGLATAAVESYTIAGRQLRNYPLADLVKLEAKLKSEVAAERRAAGIKDSTGTVRRVLVRMR